MFLNTNPGLNYTVQISSDMRDWTTLTNFMAGDFTFEMRESIPVTNSRRFYRAFVR